jgi:iron complex transport system substrate-binding protein
MNCHHFGIWNFILLFVLTVWPWHAALSAESITIEDLGKRSVTVPRNPQRIICLSQGTLRLITMLGAADRVVGIEKFEKTRPIGRPYMLAAPDLVKLPTVGPGGPGSTNAEPDLEAVLKIRPEVIFISYMEPANADALQGKLGIPVVILTHGRFGGFDDLVFDSLRVAGKILSKEQRADDVIAYIRGAITDAQKRSEGALGVDRPRVYVGGVGFKGVQAIESTDASYSPFEWLHADNIAKRVASSGHIFIDKEKLLEWNPDIIFLDGGGLNLVKQDYLKKPDFYAGLNAFKEKRVYLLFPFNYYVTNISTTIADAYAVGKTLYPDRFSDIDLKQKADEIYTFFYGKPVYESMEKDFGVLGSSVDFTR